MIRNRLIFNTERKKMVWFSLAYFAFYSIAFRFLEDRIVQVNLLMTEIDEMIPFCEYFVIPYVLWFPYLLFAVVYFWFFCKDTAESKKMLHSFALGMGVFLYISFLFPNGHALRPVLVGDSICIKLMRLVHLLDTPTNIFPSLHVFGTVAASIALLKQKELTDIKGFKIFILVLSILIVASTCFIKQHTFVDVVGALLLNTICYFVYYYGKSEVKR